MVRRRGIRPKKNVKFHSFLSTMAEKFICFRNIFKYYHIIKTLICHAVQHRSLAELDLTSVLLDLTPAIFTLFTYITINLLACCEEQYGSIYLFYQLLLKNTHN